MNKETDIAARPDAVKTIVFGGLTVGILDLIDAVTFFGLYYAVPPVRIFQSIAAGVYGRDAAREGGWTTAIQGILLHFVIATLIATVFYIGTRFLPVLYKKPVICGLVYGVICYFVMQMVVIPLSNAPSSGISINPPFWNGIIGHALLVGLPVALIARWSAKKDVSQTTQPDEIYDWTRNKRTCDIVMKGGITSGVVYPKAIAKLAQRFRFVNIGGTSAGAIAAAVAAAAEFRRAQTGSNEGFTKIDGLGNFLADNEKDDPNTRLFSLFKPNRKTRRIFEILTGALGHKSKWASVFVVLWRAIKHNFITALLGTIPGATLGILSYNGSTARSLTVIWLIAALFLAIAGGSIAILLRVGYQFITEVPKNYFGLCSGMPDPGSIGKGSTGPLTLWLTGYLNEVAGIESFGRPLVFGDLWNPKKDPDKIGERVINLEMMTANLTHGRPYRMPFRYDDDLKENHLFYFRKDEFCRLFPDSVVNWMVSKPRKILEDNPNELQKREAERKERAEGGYYPLPDPENLPVVVATRMSLSFPILLSAVPLYSIDYTILDANNKPKAELERCWFTDGGTCSNFPLHFFDSTLPKRPTFSINLTSKPEGTDKTLLIPEMDDNNIPPRVDRWYRFDRNISANPDKNVKKGGLGQLSGFAGTLISTMQNWNDSTVSCLPGYRDRIVRIPLTSEQGGLNLNMPEEVVTFLTTKGKECADELIRHFDVPPTHERMTWENHRWIRLRSMFAALEKMIKDTISACDGPENSDISYENWLAQLNAAPVASYKHLGKYKPTKEQIQAALDTIGKLREIDAIWKKTAGAAKDSPRPRPSLRPRPQI